LETRIDYQKSYPKAGRPLLAIEAYVHSRGLPAKLLNLAQMRTSLHLPSELAVCPTPKLHARS
jgi:hypothetical protein